jgi:hypothetical protein
MVNFEEQCSTVIASFAPENGVNDVASSWKMEVLL